MTLKSLIIAATVAMTPGFVLAMGCSSDHAAASCADGTVWDRAQQRCVSTTG